MRHLDGPPRAGRGRRHRRRPDPPPYRAGAGCHPHGGEDRLDEAAPARGARPPAPGISRCRSSLRLSAAARSSTTRSPRPPCSTGSRSAAMPTTCSELFDIDRDSLPEIDDATARAGALSRAGAELTGLPVGTPVAVGTGDDFANPIGAGVVAPGVVACNLGTAEVIGTVSDSLRIDGGGLVETHDFLGDRYLVGNPGWLAGGAVTWFLSTFGVATPAELSRLAAEAPPGCNGLTFLPALSGAMAPRWVAEARGAFYGLTASHGKAACARALLEGCAFAMRDRPRGARRVDHRHRLRSRAQRARRLGGAGTHRGHAGGGDRPRPGQQGEPRGGRRAGDRAGGGHGRSAHPGVPSIRPCISCWPWSAPATSIG